MKILHTVAFYPPYDGGGATEVVRQISKRLAKRNHDVTVATAYHPDRKNLFDGDVKIAQFNVKSILGQSILGIYGEIKKYQDFIINHDFDVMMNYAAQTWCTDLCFPILDSIHSKKILATCGFSGLIGFRKPIYQRYYRLLPEYLTHYDRLIYHQDNYVDKIFCDSHDLTHCEIIPNGVDLNLFSQPTIDFRFHYGIRTKYMLLSVGNHYQNKGHKRIIDAFLSLKRDDISLVIIGHKSENSIRGCWRHCKKEADRNPRLLLIDNVPKEIIPSAYKCADILLSGSYIEVFPLVIIESLACKTPFIAFPAGNIEHLEGGVVVQSVNEMSHQIQNLLSNIPLREELASKGENIVKSNYDWEMIVNQYENIYAELVHKNI